MRGPELYQRARRIIPGGTQLLSKRPEMFLPSHWPSYFSRARGVEVTDLDGRCYTDMSLMGVGACILGYADEDIDAAVREAVARGVACTLNAPEEVELAELLLALHPWAQMVRYTRSGGEAVAVAVRIARAATGRDRVAFCGYHGGTDWYLAANLARADALDGHLLPGLSPLGIPRGLEGTALPFRYNHLDDLLALLAEFPREIAAIVMEPQRGEPPRAGFLEAVREMADRSGAVLVFDEITTGFRMATGGIHRVLGVDPDLAVFAKGMANGYAMAAVIGRATVMRFAQETFLSSTNWTERIGPAAALATIRKHRERKVAAHLVEIGSRVRAGWEHAAGKAGLAIHCSGLPSLCHFSFEHPRERVLATLFTQLMLDRGFLAFTQFKPSYAHRPCHVERYLDAVCEVMDQLHEALETGRPESLLRGDVASTDFHRIA